MIDIVIARYNENIEWIRNLDPSFNIIIYNKGAPLQLYNMKNVTVINVPNKGRESETYLRYIYDRYENLPDATIFVQGDPFDHCNDIFAFLNAATKFIGNDEYNFIPFTNGWLLSANVPYTSVYENTKICIPGLPYIFIDTSSTRTLNSLLYHDRGVDFIKEDYIKHHNLPHGSNLIHHFLSKANLGHLIPKSEHVYNMFFAAQFLVKREIIQKIPRESYKILCDLCIENSSHIYMIERCWLTLFDGYNAPSFRKLMYPMKI